MRDIELVTNAWRQQGSAALNTPTYRNSFVGGDVYTGLKRMFTGMAALAEVEMAGERMNVPLLSSDQEEEQSCFSDTSAEDLRANAAGIEHVYFARSSARGCGHILGKWLNSLVPRRASETMFRRIGKCSSRSRGSSAFARICWTNRPPGILAKTREDPRVTLKCYCEGLDGNLVLKSCVRP